ncbi:hypothetical protein GGS23DRAFT_588514 [Durotheca rogersii]|uniref:uncharacterized protein n=1 Tax=Durotheca rogersii TaxID=419775 RepID=UPI0022204A94|nr:uncharacterized protein GGS23DRAFT_588514 [Durotheca rogersii]KAI5856762.1 hypothetical protein GGS23DRAFT_588514 [Durotheca rogersii]
MRFVSEDLAFAHIWGLEPADEQTPLAASFTPWSDAKRLVDGVFQVETLPLTSSQLQILNSVDKSDLWASYTFKLPKHMSFSFDRLRMTWQALAAHHSILRTVIEYNDNGTAPTHQAIHQHIIPIALGVWNPVEKNIPYLVYGEATSSFPTLTLHFNRALLDTRSLPIIWHDFNLFYHGYGFPARVPFSFYATKSLAKGEQLSIQQGETPQYVSLPQPDPSVPIIATSSDGDPGLIMHLIQAPEINIQALLRAAWAYVLSRHVGTESVSFYTNVRDGSAESGSEIIGPIETIVSFSLTLDPGEPIHELTRRLESDLMYNSPLARIDAHIGGIDKLQVGFYVTDLDVPGCRYSVKGAPIQVSVCLAAAQATMIHHPAINPSKADVILGHFWEALRQLSDPSRLLRDVNLVSATERAILLSFGAAAFQSVEPRLVHSMIEEQVAHNGEGIAIESESGDEKITFSQLNAIANRVARQLLPLLGQSKIVPVHMEVSVNFVVALLAILKAGAAYTILDPAQPAARKSYIIEDVGASFVLVDRLVSNRGLPQVSTLDIESLIQSAAEDSNLELEISHEATAYVIYTSGSTGTPKGVILSHRAASAGITCAPTIPDNRVLLFYNPIFSAAQRTILSTIAHGGCLCVASRARLQTSLADIVKKMEITTLGITSSTIALVNPLDVPNLKRVTLTGESLEQSVVDRWADRVDLRNSYGLSECTQLNFGRTMESGDRNPSVVGEPTDTTAAYILDPDTLNLTPLSVPGELCLEGPQLATGYLNKPAATAKSFIDSPFRKGLKLYRTGDSAIRHEDGSIEIIGRIDFQTKINGQRVEPAEIAKFIRKQDGVTNAVVVAANVDGEKVLTACVVSQAGADWAGLVTDLRTATSAAMPLYMVPKYWLSYDTLPLNHNGKTDILKIRSQIQKLGRPELLRSSSRKVEKVEFLSEQEETLHGVVSKVLDLAVDSVSTQHSFLELGGDSLKGLSVIAALVEVGWAIGLGDLIRAVSLAQAAETMVQSEIGDGEDDVAFSLLPSDARVDREIYEDAYPASELQSGIISANETVGGYVYDRIFSIAHLDISRLRRAFQAVIDLNPIYRTSFVPNGVTITQAVNKSFELPWEFVDGVALDEYISKPRHPFLSVDKPAIRATVVNNSLLIISVHHALFDFWSSRFLFEDVAAYYQDHTVAQRAPFKNFMRYLGKQDQDGMKTFWASYLDGAVATRIASEPAQANVAKARITTDIHAACLKLGVSVGVLLYFSWAITLWKHTGNTDVTFAITLSGRDVPLKGIQDLNGPTLTTAPLRVQLDPATTLAEGLKNMRDAVWTVSEKSQFGLRRSLQAAGHSPDLFDTLVNYLVSNPASSHTQVLHPYGEKPIWQTGYTSLEVQENTKGSFDLGLSSTLDPLRAQFIVDQVVNILDIATTNSNKKLEEISIIPEPERRYLDLLSPSIEAVNGLLHKKFENIAETDGSRTAIEFESSEVVSFRELNERANRFAHFLKAKGLGPDRLLPICLPKSVEAIVSMLAVLKAGGAFVVLDPDNPPERNNFIVEDVSATMILTDENLRSIFDNEAHGAEVVDFYRIDELQFPSSNPDEVHTQPDNLAYCIYTSGSTGLPKGVLVPHGAISAGIDSIVHAESFDPTWRVLQFSNFVFDVSIGDVFCSLSTGATLCMASMESLLSNLTQVVNDMRINRLFLTPTVAKLLHPTNVPGVEGIYLAGEPVPQDIVEIWSSHCTVMNCYGPTEASILAAAGYIAPGANSKVIGHPLRNIQALILEPNSFNEVPYGAIGELCLAGPQLARGYLNRPEATEKAFVTRNNEKVYRTGDLVRWLPNRRIECFGRIDSQIKVHGHRIELGEIESAIRRAGSVHNAIVIVQEVQNSPALIAFCVMDPSKEGGVLPPEEYTETLTSLEIKLTSLPPYMVPKIWIPVGTLPLLPSGKADRKKLSAWIRDMARETLQLYSGMEDSAEYVEPATPEEQVLQALWSELFNKTPEDISATSAFFAHGGDSISAINLVGRCRNRGFLLAVSDVLAFPLLQDMAGRMKSLKKTHEHIPTVRIGVTPEVSSVLSRAGLQESDVETVLPVVPGIEDFLTRANRKEQFWNCQTVRPLPEVIDFDLWLKVTTELTARNEILRSMWFEADGSWKQVVLAKPVLDFKILECSTNEEKQRLIDSTWDEGFVVGKPFIKYRLLTLPDGSRDLLIHIHHAMYDGTLLRIFDDEFKALYKGTKPPYTVSFGEYVTYMDSTDREKSLRFWTELLDNSPERFPNVDSPSTSGLVVKTADRQVDSFAAASGITVSIVFQTAFSLLLCQLSGRHDVTYDNLITGRNVDMEDAQTIAGTCANFLPFRTSFTADTGIRDLLKATQSLFWKTTENGNVGLNDIYRALGQERDAVASRALFLFQPFDQPIPSSSIVEKNMRWMVMALSKVRMPMDYALHLEVSKTAAGYNLKFKYDSTVYSAVDMEGVADAYAGLLERIMAHSRSKVVTIL